MLFWFLRSKIHFILFYLMNLWWAAYHHRRLMRISYAQRQPTSRLTHTQAIKWEFDWRSVTKKNVAKLTDRATRIEAETVCLHMFPGNESVTYNYIGLNSFHDTNYCMDNVVLLIVLCRVEIKWLIKIEWHTALRTETKSNRTIKFIPKKKTHAVKC